MSKDTWRGKVVWITGGGSGIGRALALEFARQGACVAVSGRRVARLEEVVEQVGAAQAMAVACDVTQVTALEEAAAAVAEAWGGIDVVVANAGFGVGGRIESLTQEEWRRQLDVNVVGLAQTVKVALPYLRQRAGRVVLMGSVAGMIPMPGIGAYHASKYAVRAIGQTLSMELVHEGVSCTTIHPGFVESEIGQVDNQGVFREQWQDKRPTAIMWSAQRAAKACLGAIKARRREFTFTGHGRVLGFAGRHFPAASCWVIERMAGKQEA